MLTSSSADLLRRLRDDLRACTYPGYVYGYPHKKAYRPLPPRPPETMFDHLYAELPAVYARQRRELSGGADA